VRSAGLAVGLALVLGGCHAAKQPAYEDRQGFHFTPPPGWVERARDDALPVKSGHRQPDLPLPKLGGSGSSTPERLLVRYDRLTAGYLAWLRVTTADVPPAGPLKALVSARSPGSSWKPESASENLEVSGLPAARAAFVGRWGGQGYLSETVAVRQGERVYVITASFPSADRKAPADRKAREQVRQAVAGATWQ
jgi:hypothetical protein